MKNANFSARILNVKGFAAEREAMEKAQADYEAAQHREVKAVTDYLRDNPDEVLTCGKIGAMFGVSAPHAYAVMHKYKSGSGVRDISIDVTRQFAEINQCGEVIEGGGIITKKQTLTGFTAW